MIIYYSSQGRGFGDPAVVIGDKANVMQTFWDEYCRREGSGVTKPMERLKRARKHDPKRIGYYSAWKDYKPRRPNETLYSAWFYDERHGTCLPYSDPTPLLFSLVRDVIPTIGFFIARHEPDGTFTPLYRCVKEKKWKRTKCK